MTENFPLWREGGMLVEDCLAVFNSVTAGYGLMELNLARSTFQFKLTSKVDNLEEAYQFILQMPIEPSAGAWGALFVWRRTIGCANCDKLVVSIWDS
ncbi:hypothetical protein LIER_22277 [Lithospermum erythrorhizon]|uniref:Uncharacterized protein n=1 Tax=Lithospermum erythrorhizon TaxID=34254 RepID=A0AAV3QUG4_LITER